MSIGGIGISGYFGIITIRLHLPPTQIVPGGHLGNNGFFTHLPATRIYPNGHLINQSGNVSLTSCKLSKLEFETVPAASP